MHWIALNLFENTHRYAYLRKFRAELEVCGLTFHRFAEPEIKPAIMNLRLFRIDDIEAVFSELSKMRKIFRGATKEECDRLNALFPPIAID
jgi:hypothetical protein